MDSSNKYQHIKRTKIAVSTVSTVHGILDYLPIPWHVLSFLSHAVFVTALAGPKNVGVFLRGQRTLEKSNSFWYGKQVLFCFFNQNGRGVRGGDNDPFGYNIHS